jgi:micrococcal nuclease
MVGWRWFCKPLAVLLLSTAPCLAWEGRVVGVHDGDTVTVLTPQKRMVHVRLAHIDCPELGQPYGKNAKQALSDMVFNSTVEVTPYATDRYGRTVGDVSVNGVLVTHELVRSGLCLIYNQYNKGTDRDAWLDQLQADAKSGGRGVWSQPGMVPPWEYRKHKVTH